MIAHEYIDAAISIKITNLTIISALKNKLSIEKSALEVKPNSLCCYICFHSTSSHTKMCHEYDSTLCNLFKFICIIIVT